MPVNALLGQRKRCVNRVQKHRRLPGAWRHRGTDPASDESIRQAVFERNGRRVRKDQSSRLVPGASSETRIRNRNESLLKQASK